MLVRDGLRGPYFAVGVVFLSIFVLHEEERKCEALAVIEREVKEVPKRVEKELKKRSVLKINWHLSLLVLVTISSAGIRFLLNFLKTVL